MGLSTTPSSKVGLMEIFNREIGLLPPRKYARRLYASQTLVERIDLYGKLNGHQGCVNTIAFNCTGELLLSGSDDQQIMLWDWAAEKLTFSYPSGHNDNIFQAKFMPLTNDRKIITSSADSQVRFGELSDSGPVVTKRLSKHRGRVHSLAIEPGSPYVFYSCGEDGLVKHYDLRSCAATKLFSCTTFAHDNQSSSSVGLNSISIDPRNPNYLAAGGSDPFARVYDIRKCQENGSSKDGIVDTFCASHLINADNVHITALAYSSSSELLVSYNEEFIYLFQNDMGLGSNPFSSPSEGSHQLEDPQVYSGHRNSRTVKGVNFFGHNGEYVVSGSDCGHIFIWKKKGGQLVRLMVGDRYVVNQLESHPLIPVLATCGIEKNIKLWAPSSNCIRPLPDKAVEIMENNRRPRVSPARRPLAEDWIMQMRILRMHLEQRHAHLDTSNSSEDVDSDVDDEGETYVVGFSRSDPSEDDENSNECNVS